EDRRFGSFKRTKAAILAALQSEKTKAAILAALQKIAGVGAVRKKFVAGNWKMCTTAATAKQLAAAVVKGLGAEDRVTVMVAPPFPYLSQVAEVVRGSKVLLGGQNLYPEKEGAFTGEVSPTMLVDV